MNTQSRKKIKPKYQWERYEIYAVDSVTGEVFDDSLDARGGGMTQVGKGEGFSKLYDRARWLVRRIGIQYYWYLLYIVQSTLRSNNEIDPSVLINDGVVARMTHYRLITKLINTWIIAYICIWSSRKKRYYLNPAIASYGKYIDSNVLTLFPPVDVKNGDAWAEDTRIIEWQALEDWGGEAL